MPSGATQNDLQEPQWGEKGKKTGPSTANESKRGEIRLEDQEREIQKKLRKGTRRVASDDFCRAYFSGVLDLELSPSETGANQIALSRKEVSRPSGKDSWEMGLCQGGPSLDFDMGSQSEWFYVLNTDIIVPKRRMKLSWSLKRKDYSYIRLDKSWIATPNPVNYHVLLRMDTGTPAGMFGLTRTRVRVGSKPVRVTHGSSNPSSKPAEFPA
ncbi:hypothetical protein DFH07DRAFT_765664 [Mycena maculata]|uniref:Uncharacterized protein n=1 Tax=Mycena maculata TaxID=230809 RepID=A0AAD7NXT6_9AGAR|nr:hypothetical protein DFH07DRAFT_765664 [Mycena maculata]